LIATDYGRYKAWEVYSIKVKRSGVNCMLIPEANRPRDTSLTNLVEAMFNDVTRSLKEYQLQHLWDSISYLSIEPIHDYRVTFTAIVSLRVILNAMSRLAILQEIPSILIWRAKFNMNHRYDTCHNCTVKCTYKHILLTWANLRSVPTVQKGGVMKYRQFMVVHIDGWSLNLNLLLYYPL